MFGLRLRLMSLLDQVLHRNSDAAKSFLVAADDTERLRRIGPQDEAIENLKRAIGG